MSDPECSFLSKMWLDLLPFEVCTRVATHVSAGHQTTQLLHLADASWKLRRAALSSLSHKLLCSSTSYTGPMWTPCAGDDIVEVDLSADWRDEDKPYKTAWASVLRDPRLRRASIYADETLLKLIAGSPSLRELSIIVGSEHDLDLLFRTLSSLHITHLELQCILDNCNFVCEEQIPFCLFENPRYFNSKGNAIAQSCPYLKTLWVHCRSCSDFYMGGGALSFAFLEGLDGLEELRFNGISPIPYQSLFRSIPSIRLSSMRGALTLSIVGNSSVTEARIDDTLDETEAELAIIRRCHRLETLAMKLGEGTCELLPAIVCDLPKLEALELDWTPQDYYPVDRGDDEPYAFAVPGSILSTAQAAPNLKSLILQAVTIPIGELIQVLDSLGPRLEFLGTSIGHQQEPPSDRMKALILAIMKFNPNLLELRVFDHEEALDVYPSNYWSALLHQLRQRLPALTFKILDYNHYYE